MPFHRHFIFILFHFISFHFIFHHVMSYFKSYSKPNEITSYHESYHILFFRIHSIQRKSHQIIPTSISNHFMSFSISCDLSFLPFRISHFKSHLFLNNIQPNQFTSFQIKSNRISYQILCHVKTYIMFRIIFQIRSFQSIPVHVIYHISFHVIYLFCHFSAQNISNITANHISLLCHCLSHTTSNQIVSYQFISNYLISFHSPFHVISYHTIYHIKPCFLLCRVIP